MTKIDEQHIALALLRGEYAPGTDASGYVDDALRRLFERFEGVAIVVVEVERVEGADVCTPMVKVRAFSDFTADYPLRAIVGRMVKRAARMTGTEGAR